MAQQPPPVHIQQPGAGGGMQLQPMPPPTQVPVGCPPGLEYLAMVDQLIIKQVLEILEMITGWETNNRYRVMNTVGQQVYFIQEETTCLMRQCCGPGRGFTLHVTDNSSQEVMRIVRPFKCCAGCCWCVQPGNCCSMELQVEAPVGTVIGYVKQECSSWKPKLGIYDADDQLIGMVNGPCCVCNAPCCGDVEFPVMDPMGTTQIGMCSKQWTGALTEYFTDADNFHVKFPMDMDVRMKALFFGAMMMVDFMYFETQKKNH